MDGVNAALFFVSETPTPHMNSTKKKHPNGHTSGHHGAKKEKPAKLPHVRAREAVAKLPPARAAVEPPPARRSVSSRAAGFDDDALEGGGAFACAADAAAKATPAGKAGRARQKPP